jgi:hypothetical protein
MVVGRFIIHENVSMHETVNVRSHSTGDARLITEIKNKGITN